MPEKIKRNKKELINALEAFNNAKTEYQKSLLLSVACDDIWLNQK
jgi:hypothetical protein